MGCKHAHEIVLFEILIFPYLHRKQPRPQCMSLRNRFSAHYFEHPTCLIDVLRMVRINTDKGVAADCSLMRQDWRVTAVRINTSRFVTADCRIIRAGWPYCFRRLPRSDQKLCADWSPLSVWFYDEVLVRFCTSTWDLANIKSR